MISTKLQGIFLVLLGAVSYGLPASLIKLSKQKGLTEANILLSQFFFAVIVLGIIYYCVNRKNGCQNQIGSLNFSNKMRLCISGSALALTNSFYFASLTYVSVAIAAVMLMQSVWITSLLEFLLRKIIPSPTQLICILVVLIGTILTTNSIETQIKVSLVGLFLSFMSGVCYAVTIMVTNSLAPYASPFGRAFYVATGAFMVICLIWGGSVNLSLWALSLKWGLLIALFSIILPLLFFTIGMPKITAGMGGVLAALELPASILFAYLLVNEHINLMQLIGIILILMATSCVHLIIPRSLK